MEGVLNDRRKEYSKDRHTHAQFTTEEKTDVVWTNQKSSQKHIGNSDRFEESNITK